MKARFALLCSLLAAQGLIVPTGLQAANHREAPITALDQKADITDWYAFVSPERPDKVVFIMNVDPFLEPSNGPNYFPFDPGIMYEMKIDNNRDGLADVTFRFRFKSELRLPGVFTGFVGNAAGLPGITALDGPGSEGLGFRQSYTVSMITPSSREDLGFGQTLFAVPTNVGPKTMPDYNGLRQKGIFSLRHDIRVFAGTVADPFFIDLGGTFDSINYRQAAGGIILSSAVDADSKSNYAPNNMAGFNVNTIAIEVPISMVTRDGKLHAAGEADAVIGTWASTYRRRAQPLKDESLSAEDRNWMQIQRMGNPLINEVIIGTGSKDKFSMSEPKDDKQFANFVLDPLLAQLLGAAGIPVAPAPRKDLLLLVQYQAPLCPGCKASDAGPVADLLRLNLGIPPTPFQSQQRLGFLAGDTAGFPNGRRLNDDVVDIALRATAGILVDGKKYGTALGDGVNVPAATPFQQFPFVAPAYNGRQSAHTSGVGQPGCPNQLNGVCPVN